MKKALVTGITGQDGSCLAELKRNGLYKRLWDHQCGGYLGE